MHQTNNLVQIDPEKHVEAVRHFLVYFNISSKLPDLDSLSEIVFHFAKFPYENLSKIIQYQHHFESGGAIRLPEEVMEGYASDGLGGTCFALTFFLQCILTLKGFQPYPVMADMKWGKNVHCAMVVLLDGKSYLVDPGYLLNRPMELNSGKPRLYKTEFSGVEIVAKEENVFELYTFDRETIKWRYRFVNQPTSPNDFLQHWLDSFRWNSMHGLCLTKVEQNRLIYIHKYFMRETNFSTKKNHNIRNQYHQTIQEVFGIRPELVEEALAALENNMKNEQALGLWVPKKEWRPIS